MTSPHLVPPRAGHSHALLAAVLESSAVALVCTDPDFIIRSWNAAAENLFGYSAEEVIGRSVLALVPVAQQPEDLALIERALAGAPVAPQPSVRRHKDGSTVTVTVTLWPARAPDSQLLGLGIAFSDRTGQERAEAESRRVRVDLEQQVVNRSRDQSPTSEGLHASEERLRSLIESVHDYALVMLDPTGRVTNWNAGAERITGFTAEEVLGRHLEMLYPPTEAVGGWIGDAPGDKRFEDEGWRVRKDGSRFWANSVITPIRDSAGRPVGYACVTRDLTERRMAEESLRTRAAEMEASNRDLAEKSAENEMFVYSVSHDLRSPLVNLQGFSTELEKGCKRLNDLLEDEGLPADVRTRGRAVLTGSVGPSIKFIRTGVTRLSNIIDALLRLSRVGRVEYQWERIDLGAMLAAVVQSAQVSITQRGATVRVGELPPARGDRVAIEQVFGNLLGNALAYLAPERPGVIEVGCLPGTSNGFQTYFVRDNGLGIDEEHRARIFQAFQRAHPGVSGGDGPGLGLGLAIVVRVVERHRGRVWVESQPGVGSTFFVALPTSASGIIMRSGNR